MRILHTADWHLGKSLEGRDRLPEQRAFVDELCQLCIDERIDLVMMAGDVYQTVNPSAQAEELFYDALHRLSDQGRRAVVVIAGNHDNPERLMAPSPLCDRLGITVSGLPKSPIYPLPVGRERTVARPASGPSWAELVLPTCDETAVIAMLPYPSEARLQEILSETLDDEVTLRLSYQERIRSMFANLATHYKPDAVNLGMSHLFVQGGIESESEIQIQVGGAYAVDETVFPNQAAYVGLGHLHRPQWVGGTGRIRYSGSPLAYSFSESGYTKTVTLIEAFAGRESVITEIPITSGRRLLRWEAKRGLSEVHHWIAEQRGENAWIDLEIHVTEHLRLSDIQALRQVHPGIIHIRPVLPEMELVRSRESSASLSLAELFSRFYQSRHNHPPDEGTVQLFLELATATDNVDGEDNA